MREPGNEIKTIEEAIAVAEAMLLLCSVPMPMMDEEETAALKILIDAAKQVKKVQELTMQKISDFGQLQAALEENTRLRERLEITHVYKMIDGVLTRVEVPLEEQKNMPDGISCRDSTIKLLEKYIEELQSRVDFPSDR